MTIQSERGNTHGTEQARSLIEARRLSDEAAALMQQGLEALSSQRRIIEKALGMSGLQTGIEDALGNSEATEAKLRDASQKLIAIRKTLEDEIKERNVIHLQLAAAEEQTASRHYAAFHDVLTGLPNRALFNDRLEHAISQATRHQWMLALMFVDLDDFKTINDTYGHAAGDVVLQTIAVRLAKDTREEDTICRLGGDEFLCLLTQIHAEKDIAKIARQLHKSIQAPFEVHAHGLNGPLRINASIGIAIFPKDGTTVDGLIKSADTAMYRAKQEQSGSEFAH